MGKIRQSIINFVVRSGQTARLGFLGFRVGMTPENLFCPRRTRSGTENCFLIRGGRGELPFCPRRTRSGTENCFLIRGGRGELPFCPRRTRSGTENCFLIRGGRGELHFVHGGRGELLFDPRRTRRTAHLSTSGHEEGFEGERDWGTWGPGVGRPIEVARPVLRARRPVRAVDPQPGGAPRRR